MWAKPWFLHRSLNPNNVQQPDFLLLEFLQPDIYPESL